MEKKAIPLARSVWFPNTLGLSSKPSPHPYSQHSPKTNHYTHAINQQLHIGQGKTTPESFLALSWPKRLPSNLQQSQNILANTIHNVGKTTVCPRQRIHREDLHRPQMGKENQPPNLCVREIYTRSQYIDGNTPDTSLCKM